MLLHVNSRNRLIALIMIEDVVTLALELRKPISSVTRWINHDILAEGNLLRLFAEKSNNLG